MTLFTPLVHRRRPLLPLAPEVRRLLHHVSLAWAVAAVAALEIAGRAGWLAHRPGTETFELAVRPLFLVLFVVGALVAWRWEIVGGMIATFTAAGILVWEGQQLERLHAVVVVVAFLVPGIAWVLLDLHDRRPLVAVAGLVAASVAGATGFGVATSYYDDLFGPSHPSSTAELPADRLAEWIWTGDVTTDSATVVAKLDDDGSWYAIVHELDGERGGLVLGEVAGTTDADGVTRFTLNGLRPSRTYGVALVDRGDDAHDNSDGKSEGDGDEMTGPIEATFRTFPEGPADIVLALGSCMRVGTNGAVFDTIAALDPDVFVIDGDFHYANISDPDPEAFRDVLDLNLSRPGPSNLFRNVPMAYVWDDHDYGGNNADGTSPTRSTALSVYRQYVPSYVTTGANEPIYQAFDLGDVRVIMTDVRSERSPSATPDDADKTLLGDEQRRWLETELLAARDRYALTIWVNPVPWIGEATAGGDSWSGYSTERAGIADFIAEHDIDRVLMLSGDAHMVAIDDGTNSAYASDGSPGFPVLHAGALDRPGHVKGGPYSEGTVPGGGQFGVVEVTHTADGLAVRLTGRDWTGATLLEYSYDVPRSSLTR